MITRKQYMAKQATHREYYSQFVDESVRKWVLSAIGMGRLLRSTDPHLNDISITIWDGFAFAFAGSTAGRKCAEANESGGVSISDAVCVAKEAARQLLEERHERTTT